MGDYGFKISQDTKNINSTDPRDYVFNSKYSTVKIALQPPSRLYQTVTVGAGGSATVTIPHGLSFKPMVMLFSDLGAGHWYLGANHLGFDQTESPEATIDIGNSYVDTTNVVIKYLNTTGGTIIVKYYYFVFADNG